MSVVRTSTLVFTDVVNSTAFVAAAEDPSEALAAHLADLTWHVEHAGGTLVKSLGDGVMATFTSAVSAVLCAIAMQRSTAESSDDNPLAIRVGISSGDVRVHGKDMFGLPVVEAARLCAHANGGQILISHRTRALAPDCATLTDVGVVPLKGLPEPTHAWEAAWAAAVMRLRAVLADDAVLVREGVARLLTSAGIDVVGQASDPVGLEALLGDMRPDIAIVDVRMPPTYTTEGIDLAARLVEVAPDTAVLVLTQDPQPGHAKRLLATAPRGLGYLLKERVSDIHDFTDVVRRVAAGATVIDSCG